MSLLGVAVVLTQRNMEATRRWFESSKLHVGEFCSAAGGKLVVFEPEEDFFFRLTP